MYNLQKSNRSLETPVTSLNQNFNNFNELSSNY